VDVSHVGRGRVPRRMCLLVVPTQINPYPSDISTVSALQAEPLNFQAKEYTNCTFTIIDMDWKITNTKRDLMDQLLTSNQNNQQWTIAGVLDNNSTEFRLTPNFFDKEYCSITISLGVQGHKRFKIESSLYFFLRSRLSNPVNRFILVFEPNNKYSQKNPLLTRIGEIPILAQDNQCQ